MLHLATVEPTTLGLLKDLMALPILAPLNLAGGTSLALQIGHRKSVDLDFFGSHQIPHEVILNDLTTIAQPTVFTNSRSILIVKMNGVKVDFVNYKYLPLNPVIEVEGIRLLSILDIGAMKISAITGRGKRRDFYDLFFLLKHYDLQALVNAFSIKYPEGSILLVAKSITYFEDAEEDEAPETFQKLEWDEVKEKIKTEANKIFR
jgi:hypothetical protein